jgi:DMSO/TMAO reductase YedYZ heme-binding membrane subunit
MDWANIWNLTQSSGLVAYVLLTLSVWSGLYAMVRRKNNQLPGITPLVHNSIANGALLITLFHVAVLFFDSYTKLSWQEILIPFASPYKNVPLGIGIIGFYLLVITILTTELRATIGTKIWRALHIFSPVAYVMATIHGIWIGTSTQAASAIMYGVSAIGVVLLLMIRFMPGALTTHDAEA